MDELLAEKDTQADVVAEAVDSLGDRTEKLKIEPEKEKKVESPEGVSPEMEQRPSYVVHRMDHMKPESFVKDMKPSEMRTWKYKYEQWFRSSFTGTTPLELQVDTFMWFRDNWWLNCL